MKDPEIININTLLEYRSQLAIPEYQRPYKWDDKNCNELFFDIKNAFDANKSAYRLGNIILHEKKEADTLDIIDGQQRTISLLLLLKELDKNFDLPQLEVVPHKYTLINLKKNSLLFANLVREQYPNSETKKNFLNYILDKCEVVCIITESEPQAFQMFDSQNSRGKELDPRDLLKAFHLREFSPHITDQEKEKIDKRWVKDADKINALFTRVLYPIKAWAKGESGIEPLKDHIDDFKGISRFDKLNVYHNYARPSIYVRNYVDDYNSENQTNISYNVMSKMEYPFQLTGEILNGETFFEMIFHYCDLLDNIAGKLQQYKKFKEINGEMLLTESKEGKISSQALNKYEQPYYKFITRLFYNLLLVYADRFGIESEDFEIVAQKLFKYSFSLRNDYTTLQELSYLNFAIAKDSSKISFTNKNVCRFILNCKSIKDFMNFNTGIDASALKDGTTKSIKALFGMEEN